MCIGQGVLDESGQVSQVDGYFVDVTVADRAEAAVEVQQAVQASAESRADIEQAKGALMLVQGVTADEAFELLTWHSQHSNITLRTLAKMITDGLSKKNEGEPAEQRLSRILAGALTVDVAGTAQGRQCGTS